jgi:hypothetical protein
MTRKSYSPITPPRACLNKWCCLKFQNLQTGGCWMTSTLQQRLAGDTPKHRLWDVPVHSIKTPYMLGIPFWSMSHPHQTEHVRASSFYTSPHHEARGAKNCKCTVAQLVVQVFRAVFLEPQRLAFRLGTRGICEHDCDLVDLSSNTTCSMFGSQTFAAVWNIFLPICTMHNSVVPNMIQGTCSNLIQGIRS